jgi:hypothetical protein
MTEFKLFLLFYGAIFIASGMGLYLAQVSEYMPSGIIFIGVGLIFTIAVPLISLTEFLLKDNRLQEVIVNTERRRQKAKTILMHNHKKEYLKILKELREEKQ